MRQGVMPLGCGGSFSLTAGRAIQPCMKAACSSKGDDAMRRAMGLRKIAVFRE